LVLWLQVRRAGAATSPTFLYGGKPKLSSAGASRREKDLVTAEGIKVTQNTIEFVDSVAINCLISSK
jgi:hypothetical protein